MLTEQDYEDMRNGVKTQADFIDGNDVDDGYIDKEFINLFKNHEKELKSWKRYYSLK